MEDAQPTMDTFVGAVMVADITGFTRLTEKLSTRGSAGVELLTNCMNDFFSKVGPCVQFGGLLSDAEGLEGATVKVTWGIALAAICPC